MHCGIYKSGLYHSKLRTAFASGSKRKLKDEFGGVKDAQNQPKMLHVALYEPEIPPNTGNIARLCAATLTPLHIIGVTGFKMDDRTLKRAGLDYWGEVELHRHVDLDALYAALPNSRFLYFTTKASRSYSNFTYRTDDCLVFGP